MGLSEETQEGDIRRKKILGQHRRSQHKADKKPPPSMTDSHGNIKNKVEKHFAVESPADTVKRLEDTSPYVEGQKEKTFDQKDRLGLCLLKHMREQQQKSVGAKCHKPVKRKDADQPFGQKMRGGLLSGEHDHEAADTEKNIYAKSAPAKEADMLPYNQKGGQSSERLYAVKTEMMKILDRVSRMQICGCVRSCSCMQICGGVKSRGCA